MSNGKIKQEMDRQIGAMLAVMRVLCQAIVVKSKLS